MASDQRLVGLLPVSGSAFCPTTFQPLNRERWRRVRACHWTPDVIGNDTVHETIGPETAVRQASESQIRRSLGTFLLVVAFPLVKRHFAVHYMRCTRMAFRLGVRAFSSTAKERWRGVSEFGR